MFFPETEREQFFFNSCLWKYQGLYIKPLILRARKARASKLLRALRKLLRTDISYYHE